MSRIHIPGLYWEVDDVMCLGMGPSHAKLVLVGYVMAMFHECPGMGPSHAKLVLVGT